MRALAWITLLTLLPRLAPAMSGDACLEERKVTLPEAVSLALARARTEDARLALAYGQLHYLESKNRTRIELRPQLGLFAFSNPVLLATSIGSSLLMSRFQAPPKLALRGAQFDVLSADLARERARLDTELEIARCFFRLLEKQRWTELNREVRRGWQQRRPDLERMLKLGKITALERIRHDSRLLELEIQERDAEAEQNEEAATLGALIGLECPGTRLLAVDSNLPSLDANKTLPSPEPLIRLAMSHRGETRMLREKLEALAKQLPGARRIRFDSASAGYAYVSDNAGGTLGAGTSSGYLLGGHTGTGILSFGITLRDGGENAAAQEIAAAQAKIVGLGLEELERQIGSEVQAIWRQAEASRQRLKLVRENIELLRLARRSTKTRLDNGLSTPGALLESELELLRVESLESQAVNESKARMFHLLRVCGVEGDLEQAQRSELGL